MFGLLVLCISAVLQFAGAVLALALIRLDAALIDIGLPGMDGLQLAWNLRKRDDCRDAVLIALTGYGRAEDRRTVVEAGFDHHLVKRPLRRRLRVAEPANIDDADSGIRRPATSAAHTDCS